MARDDGDVALVRLLRGAEATWARRRAAGCADEGEDEGEDEDEGEGENEGEGDQPRFVHCLRCQSVHSAHRLLGHASCSSGLRGT